VGHSADTDRETGETDPVARSLVSMAGWSAW